MRADVLAPLRSAVLRGRRDRPVRDPPGGGARDHRLGRRRRPDVLARRGIRGAEDYRYDARARSLPGPRQQLRHHRGGEDGARRVRRLHGGVRAAPDGLRVRPGLQGQPRRDQQQERRRLHAAADGHRPRRGDARSRQAPDRSEHPRRHPPLPDRQRRLRPGVGGRLRQPRHHHRPDEEPADRGAARRPPLQDLPVDAARSPSTTAIWRRSPRSNRRASTASSPRASPGG